MFISSLVLAFSLTLVYAFQVFYPDFMSLFSNAFPPFIAGAAVVYSGFALKKYGCNLKVHFSLVWLCFAFWMMLWFLGEVCWAIYTLLLNIEIPYPSIADVFWLSGYIPLFIGLFTYVKTFWSVLSRRLIGTAMRIFLISSIPTSAVLLMPVMNLEEDVVAMFFDFAYPFTDLALLFMAILGLVIFFKGSLGKSWLLINAGIMSEIVADVLFSITTAQETYYNGHPLELFFHWGYILFILAFYVHTKEL